MPLLILRPLITAIFEYILALRVFRKGKFMPIIITGFLVSLATYQFGEFLYFAGNQDRFWLSVSLFSTTLLPAYGILLIERLAHVKGFAVFFIIASAIFAVSFFIFPSVIPQTTECNCFAKYDVSSLSGANYDFYRAWEAYYFLSLAFSLLLIAWNLVRHHGDVKNLRLALFAYLAFFPIVFVLAKFKQIDYSLMTSVMCGLAVITAVIFSYISLNKDPKTEKLRVKKESKRRKKTRKLKF